MLKKILLLSASLLAFAAFASVEVNQATEAELDGIKGLGPASTARILQARSQGEFKNWADLMARVKGIKPTKATQISEGGLTVNGAPYEHKTAPPK